VTRATAIARRLLLLPIVAAAYGWQIRLRTLPGPRIELTLPLQEPSHHAAVSVAGLVLVWAGAFALAAVVAPVRRLPPALAALERGAATCALLVVLQALSIELVREATLGFAWHAALATPAPYVAGVCAAGGTLLGRLSGLGALRLSERARAVMTVRWPRVG
jgi:hypothetical protein